MKLHQEANADVCMRYVSLKCYQKPDRQIIKYLCGCFLPEASNTHLLFSYCTRGAKAFVKITCRRSLRRFWPAIGNHACPCLRGITARLL